MSVKVFAPRRFVDDRGWFSETFSARRFSKAVADVTFVQDNISYSRQVGTLRGLHYQRPPFGQTKLVRCVRGRILDVVVDLRKASPTYGRSVSYELSADNGIQILIPMGFAHGLVTLEPDTEIAYKVSEYYAPDHDCGLRWDDPILAIAWALPASGPHLSPKDQALPFFKDFESPFSYDGTPMELTFVSDQ